MIDFSFYMLVQRGTGNLWYSPPATNRQECWDKARQWEQLCRGGASVVGWEDEMREKGWRSMKMEVIAR